MDTSALFGGERRTLIGVVHLPATPGAPGYGTEGDWGGALEVAVADARALVEGGCDALIVENFGDVPFFAEGVPAETVAAMALAIGAIREEIRRAAEDGEGGIPVGVNVLRNDWRSALGICAATGASFIRVNVFTGAAATDQGVIQGQAAEVVRERDRLCPGVEILADVHVKHARPIGGGSIAEAARDAILRGCADGVIVTGRATGAEADLADLREVREAVGGLLGKGGSGRVLVGSGLTEANAAELMALAGGAIVGTWVKQDGDVRRPVDVERVRRLRAAMDGS